MARVDHQRRQIRFRVAYFGPGLAGKATNLQVLRERCSPPGAARMTSESFQATDRLLYLELPLGRLHGYDVWFRLGTVPG